MSRWKQIDVTQPDEEAASAKRAGATQIDLTVSDDEVAAVQQVRGEAAEGNSWRRALEPFKRSRTAEPLEAAKSGRRRAQGDKVACDCEGLTGRRVFKNFSTACKHYEFPGSHQVGSYGPKRQGIVRTYSNATPGKDVVLDGGSLFLYRLKDEAVRAQFKVNVERRREVRVFRKVSSGVVELGLFRVEGFVAAGPGDDVDRFGREFVRMVRAEAEQSRAAAAPLDGLEAAAEAARGKRARAGPGPRET